MKDDIKQAGIYVLLLIMAIIGWFLNDFMMGTEGSFANIYAYRDSENLKEIEYQRERKDYWHDKYLNLLETTKTQE